MLTIHKDRDDITPALRGLLGKLSDFSEPMEGIGSAIKGRISARFETQTDPNGQAWHPWAKSTDKYYPRPGSKYAKGRDGAGNGRLLDRYGHMLGNLNYQPGLTEVVVGFAHDYATHHEFGTKKNGNTHIPRRGLIFANPQSETLSADDEQAVIDIINDWLALA